MAPAIEPVFTTNDLPKSTEVAIIGGGIVGLSAALYLAERGIPTVVLEKGTIACEQSSRNLGWIRKASRAASDVPLALKADELWSGLAARVGRDVGYRQSGIMFLADSEEDMNRHESWLESVSGLPIEPECLSSSRVDQIVPDSGRSWIGALYLRSDGRAEPTMAASAIARAAIDKGAAIIENCGARSLTFEAGAVRGIRTERGELRCQNVILAGGIWSRRFLGNHGISLPTLPLVASVIATDPIEGPTDIAVGGSDFSFRKRHDGGFTVTHRGALVAPITLDHAMIGLRFLHQLNEQGDLLRISLGAHFLRDLKWPRRWSANSVSPFERCRTMDPVPSAKINSEAMSNLASAFPVFGRATVRQTWAGMMDVTPDSLPAIGPVNGLSGLTIAAGFSGHGFGTAPAAGQLAAEMATGANTCVDPEPYRHDRF